MKDQQRFAHIADRFLFAPVFEIVQKLRLDAKRTPADVDVGRAVAPDIATLIGEQMPDVFRCRRRAHGRHGLDCVAGLGRHQGGGPAKTVADQQARRRDPMAYMIDGVNEVLNVRGEIGVGEVAVAATQAGKVETQYPDAGMRQGIRNAGGGVQVLAAGEAMREYGQRVRLAVIRQFQRTDQGMPLAVVEGITSTDHRSLPS